MFIHGTFQMPVHIRQIHLPSSRRRPLAYNPLMNPRRPDVHLLFSIFYFLSPSRSNAPLANTPSIPVIGSGCKGADKFCFLSLRERAGVRGKRTAETETIRALPHVSHAI